jgi:predicted DCC family thiol-disulfide oxidoreductase YuxK
MRGYPVEYAEKPAQKHDENTAYRVLYDGQCEICQAWVSWLKALDRKNKTISLPISAEVLPTVDSRLRMDECLRQLHVVTPEDEIYVGWDAVTCLARLFPSTWLIGVLGKRFFTILGGCYTGSYDEQILPQQIAVGCLPRCETRDGTTASRTGYSGRATHNFFIRCRWSYGRVSGPQSRTSISPDTTNDSIC